MFEIISKIINCPMFTLFFDVTANHGWNVIAWAVYAFIACLIGLAVHEFLIMKD
jgi:hypothetical protein